MGLSLALEDAILIVNRRYRVKFEFVNDSGTALEVRPSLELELGGALDCALVGEPARVGPSEARVFEFELRAGREGRGVLRGLVDSDGRTVASAELPVAVADPRGREPLTVVFVWHHHQAPNYLPDGTLHSDWAFRYVYGDLFEGFEGGPYSVHLELHESHGAVRDVDHLSPSLLDQWERACREGYRTPDGYVPPDDGRVERVRRVLEGYRRLVRESRVEPMFSVFAHTVQGLVLRRLAVSYTHLTLPRTERV